MNKWWVSIIITFPRLISDTRSLYKILTFKSKRPCSDIYFLSKKFQSAKQVFNKWKYQSLPDFTYIAPDGIFCVALKELKVVKDDLWTLSVKTGNKLLFWHSRNPPPLIKVRGGRGWGGGGEGPFKNWVRVPKIWLERQDNSEKGGDWRRNGGTLFLLLYSSIAFTVCVGGKKFVLLHFDSSVFLVKHTRFSSKTL